MADSVFISCDIKCVSVTGNGCCLRLCHESNALQGKVVLKLLYCLSDTSLCHLPQDAPLDELALYAQLLLETGIDRLEVPWPMWQRLREQEGIKPEKFAVVIQNPDEREQARHAGIGSFVTEASVFTGQFAGSYPDVLVVVPVDDTGNLSMDVSWRDRCAGLRVSGFAGGMQGDYAAVFQKLQGIARSFDADNRYSLGTAASVEWLLAGGMDAVASFGGVGGHAPLEQLLAALHVICGSTSRLVQVPRLRALFSQLVGKSVSPYAPVMGKEIFTYESGIHADGIQKNPKTYEPFSPEAVGMTRRLSIGKHSGKAALRTKLLELNLHVREEELDWLSTRVREESTRLRRGFTDEELAAFIRFRRGRQ